MAAAPLASDASHPWDHEHRSPQREPRVDRDPTHARGCRHDHRAYARGPTAGRPRLTAVSPSARSRKMPGPFIFIATNRLKEGKLEDEKRRVAELSRSG